MKLVNTGFPSYDDWNYLRQFSAQMYQPNDDTPCKHGTLEEFCEKIVASSTEGDTNAYDATQVPWTIFKLKKGFSWMGGVACVVAFKGTEKSHKGDIYTDLTEVGSTSRTKWYKTERMKTAVSNVFNLPAAKQRECPTLIATGHSLGGCTALNAAVYGGIRAFTFAGPGPSRGGGNKSHRKAFDAITGSATIYSNPDTIPFAGAHIGDWVCGQGGAPVDHPSKWSRESYDNLVSLNDKGAGSEALSSAALAAHSHILEELIPPTNTRGQSCFQLTGHSRGHFASIVYKKGSQDLDDVAYFKTLFDTTGLPEPDPKVDRLLSETET